MEICHSALKQPRNLNQFFVSNNNTILNYLVSSMRIETLTPQQLPLPDFFDPEKVAQVWRVPYQERANQAQAWVQKYQILKASEDKQRVCLLLIDVQNTFCLPEFELFVGGKSGKGAIEDNQRLCEFIYRNLGTITQIVATLDTHTAMQIFHPVFWINEEGEHPLPTATQITPEDLEKGTWRVNPVVATNFGADYQKLTKYAHHYVNQLSKIGKYPLTVWPYHSMLGGIGHALVSAVEEALFFHNIARGSQTRYEIKGDNYLTENYSVLQPEVLANQDGEAIARKNQALIKDLLAFDKIIVAGQAKSHCLAWTVADLLQEIQAVDPNLAQKVYLLEDCTSPVVVPGVVDYTADADAAFAKFSQAGMHLIQSTDEIP